MPALKLLYIGLNPIQNVKPYRLMDKVEGIEQTVVYLKESGANLYTGKENITKAAFNNDMLSGYKHVFLPNKQLKKGGGFLSYYAPTIKAYVKQNDIVVIYGHSVLSFWLAMFAAKSNKTKLVLTTDATYIEATAESSGLKMKLKPAFLKWLYNKWADAVFVPSTASKNFLTSIGIKEDKIAITPYVVDEDLISETAASTDIISLRRSLKIDADDFVFVFCAKFIERKRPVDAIEAFAKLNDANAKLVMIGDGPLKPMMQQRIKELGLENKILLPGIVQYSKLASYYTASNVLVFTSDHEPYGLPVNEAMLCGIPVIVSDRIGARLDLVEDNKTGWVYKTGDVEDLFAKMQFALQNKDHVKAMGQNAKHKMKQWSSNTSVERQLDFFRKKGWLN